jgi:hypothetical protein
MAVGALGLVRTVLAGWGGYKRKGDGAVRVRTLTTHTSQLPPHHLLCLRWLVGVVGARSDAPSLAPSLAPLVANEDELSELQGTVMASDTTVEHGPRVAPTVATAAAPPPTNWCKTTVRKAVRSLGILTGSCFGCWSRSLFLFHSDETMLIIWYE